MDYLKSVLDYAGLGYSITIFSLYGKEALRMEKIYSYKIEGPIVCEQIIHWSQLANKDYREKIFSFMYEDIQQQEKTGKLYKGFEK